MKSMIQRFIDTFKSVKGDMSPVLADDLAWFCTSKLSLMTQSVATNISLCPVYQGLETSISFPEWFFLACAYGPNNANLRTHRD